MDEMMWLLIFSLKDKLQCHEPNKELITLGLLHAYQERLSINEPVIHQVQRKSLPPFRN